MRFYHLSERDADIRDKHLHPSENYQIDRTKHLDATAKRLVRTNVLVATKMISSGAAPHTRTSGTATTTPDSDQWC